MPTYEYACKDGHQTTERRGYGSTSISCDCGLKAQRAPFNWSYIHGAGPAGKLSVDQLDPERFLDTAEEVDYAYTKADNEVGKKLKRPSGYKAGIVRARALQIEREGFDHKTVNKLNELDARAV